MRYLFLLTFIGGNGFNSPKLSEIAGKAADGATCGSPWFLDYANLKNKVFVKAYNIEHKAENLLNNEKVKSADLVG